MSRNADRAAFSVEQRMSLAEQDLDRFDLAVDVIRRALNRQTFALVGAVISFTTAAIILAWQVALHR